MSDPPSSVLLVHSADEGYGSDRILVLIVDVLRDRGHRVEVALPDDSGPGWLSETLRAAGVRVHVRPLAVVRRRYLSPRSLPRLVIDSVRVPFGVRRLMRERSLDVLYLNSLALMALLFVPATPRSRTMLHGHEIIVDPKPFALTQRLAPRRCRRVFAVSHAVRHAFGDADNVRVVHNGLPERATPPRRPTATADGPVEVLFVGRLSDWKGVDDFIAMAARIDRPNVRFRIVGGPVPGEEGRAAEIEQTCAESGGRIRYVGEVDDGAALMDEADILVVPSRRPDPYPTVVLEGQRAGCVVVATDGGGAAEAIVHGVDGIIVPRGDVDALTAVVDEVVADDDRRRSMAERALEAFSDRHTIGRFRERLDHAYEEIAL